MPPRCPDTQDLHINVPPAPSTPQRKAVIWVLFLASRPHGAGAGLCDPHSPSPSPGNILVAQDRKAGGGGRAGKGPEDVLGGRLGGRTMRCIDLLALLHREPPRGSVRTLHVGIHAARPQPSPADSSQTRRLLNEKATPGITGLGAFKQEELGRAWTSSGTAPGTVPALPRARTRSGPAPGSVSPRAAGADAQPYGQRNGPRFTLQTDKRLLDDPSAFAHPWPKCFSHSQ